jgi:hypothetical protein
MRSCNGPSGLQGHTEEDAPLKGCPDENGGCPTFEIDIYDPNSLVWMMV